MGGIRLVFQLLLMLLLGRTCLIGRGMIETRAGRISPAEAYHPLLLVK